MATAENKRQNAQGPGANQATAAAADIQFARDGIAACKVSGVNPTQFYTMLAEHGLQS
jgi:hypothetical protein